jgi:hypothetical protein
MKKVLWVVDGVLQHVIDKAKFIGADTICARTTNSWIATSIDQIHQNELKLYGWRWPNVQQVPPEHDSHRLYAMNEAQFVSGLINSGLDGYIADIECDKATDSNCWNDVALKPLAIRFCAAIKTTGRAKNPRSFSASRRAGRSPNLTTGPTSLGPNSLAHQTRYFRNPTGSPTALPYSVVRH